MQNALSAAFVRSDKCKIVALRLLRVVRDGEKKTALSENMGTILTDLPLEPRFKPKEYIRNLYSEESTRIFG